jgi:ketosteroid isomerase-like protein
VTNKLSCTELAQQLFEHLAQRDGAAMARLYAPDARFGDPVFGELLGADIGRRLRLLTGQIDPSFSLEVVGVALLDADTAHAKWRSWGKIAPDSQSTRNEIVSTLLVRDGLITQHYDSFEFSQWAPQALGLTGRLFARSAWLQRRTQRRSRAALAMLD